MSTTIALRHAALARAVSDVRMASMLLEESTGVARRQVTGLLADWQGGAAHSFAAAFDDWLRAAAACGEALERIEVGLSATDADFRARDDGAAREMSRLGAALGRTPPGDAL